MTTPNHTQGAGGPEPSSLLIPIREFIAEVAEQKGIGDISDEEDLTENGILDSLAIFRLIQFLEDTFGIRIPDEEILNENFESIAGIGRFVNAKLPRG